MGFIADVKRRTGRDKTDDVYQEIDDKWLFSKAYFEEIALSAGFSSVIVENIHEPKGQLSSLIATFLRIGAMSSIEDLPQWARSYCYDADKMFLESASEITTEAIVVFKK